MHVKAPAGIQVHGLVEPVRQEFQCARKTRPAREPAMSQVPVRGECLGRGLDLPYLTTVCIPGAAMPQ